MTEDTLQLTAWGEGPEIHDGPLVIRPHKVVVGLVIEGERQHNLLLQIDLVNSKDWIIFQ